MKATFLPFILFFIGFNAHAQMHEIGIAAGTSNLLGDYGGGPGNGTLFIKDIDLQASQFAGGLYYRFHLNRKLKAKASANFGHLKGSDDYTSEQERYDRGLSSTTPLSDFTVQLEYDLFPSQVGLPRSSFSPYIGAGIGYAIYNPTVSHRSGAAITPEALPGYSTIHSYVVSTSKNQMFTVPITAGVKLNYKYHWLIGMQWSHRITFEDDLDMYVTQENDQYFLTTLSLGYVFYKQDPLFGCPKF